MLEIARAAGLTDPLVLAPDAPLPALPDFCYTLATDDLVVLSTEGPGGTLKGVNSFDKSLAKHGVIKQGAKDVNDETSGTSLGIDLVDGTAWWGESSKMWTVLQRTLGILQGAPVSPRGMAAHMGLLQWLDLLERLKLSFYGDVYSFYSDPTSTSRRPVPAGVKTELLCGAILGCFWTLNMSTPFLPIVACTDASSSYGLGATVAEAPMNVVIDVARFHGLHDVFVTFDMDVPLGVKAPSHLGTRHRVPLHDHDFVTVVKLRMDDDEHINVREALGLLAFVKWLTRSAGRFGRRVVIAVDSKVVHGAVAKGRSPSWSLRRVLRQLGCLCLASGTLLFVVFVPTHWNSADRPSRGLPDRAGDKRLSRRLERLLRRTYDSAVAASRWDDYPEDGASSGSRSSGTTPRGLSRASSSASFSGASLRSGTGTREASAPST